MGWKRGATESTYSMKGYFSGDWRKVEQTMRASVLEGRLKNMIPGALRRAGDDVQEALRQAITSKRWIGNHPLTIEIKGQNDPLVDTGDMRASVTSMSGLWNELAVGIPDGRTSSGADRRQVVSALVHGSSIPVTPRMRSMFAALARVSRGDMPAGRLRGRARALYRKNPGVDWKPLKRGKKFIRIPKRSFGERVYRSRAVRDSFVKHLRAAVYAAFSLK
mgnify:CR=1 FL=1